jgi:hypothetical protein
MLASIFEDEGLFDERPCESGWRSANAKDFAGKPLIVRRLAGRETSEQSIPEQGVALLQYVVRPPDLSKVAAVENEHSSLASQQANAEVTIAAALSDSMAWR